MADINIGTSGWSYKHWRELFYPPKLRAADWLSFYSRFFTTTEINGSFYRMPAEEHVINWTRQVPPGFLFCPKMSRFVTHMKKLNDPEEPLERFFEVFEPMRPMMGPVLLQLPPMLAFHYDKADYFFSLLRRKYGKYQFVIEVRHNSWMHDDSLTLMTKYDIGFVISQSGVDWPYSEMVTAKNIYVRFHGPKELYASSYTNEMLESFADKFLRWVAEGHTIWAYFNNDIYGYAPEDAKRLTWILERKQKEQ
jgi:uncharacterized protein YecE (DUF72 family)